MLFAHRQFLVKERVAVLKLTDTYEIFDPQTNATIGVAKDEPGALAKYARLLVKKALLPTTVNVYESEAAPPVLSLHKKAALLRTTVIVTGQDQRHVGRFRSKLFSIGGGFYIFDGNGQQVAEVKGNWKGWHFRLLSADGAEMGVVTKKWAGLGKELFTTADNYMISVADHSAPTAETAALLLAAGLAIDTVFKERK